MTSLRDAAWRAGSPFRLVAVSVIRAYQVSLGRITGGRCRFHPSCSQYAIGAIGNMGLIRGLALATWRVTRCNPLFAGGVEYPPAGVRRPAPFERSPERGVAA